MSLTIRPAASADEALVFAFVRELAEYERLSHEVEATEADLAQAPLLQRTRAFAEIALSGGEPAGFALWFYNYSTFRGRHGIYLEDLFVRPACRGMGSARG